MAGFKWTGQRKDAARLLGTTSLSLAEVAQQVGVSPIVLAKWRKEPAFVAEVNELEGGELEEAQRLPHARRADRIRTLSDLANRLLQVTRARAVLEFDSAEEQDGYERNGGGSGLVTTRKRMVGSGDFGFVVVDYSVDNATVTQLREVLKQLAVEVGQYGTLEVDPTNSQIVVTFAERPDGPQ